MNPDSLKQLEWEISNLGVLLSIPLFSGVVHSYPFTVLSLMPYHTFVIQPFVTKPSLIKNLVSLLNHESFTCWQWLTRDKCQNISECGFKCPISAQKWRLIYDHVQSQISPSLADLMMADYVYMNLPSLDFLISE